MCWLFSWKHMFRDSMHRYTYHFHPIVICSLSIWNSNTYPLAFVMLLFLSFLLSSPFSLSKNAAFYIRGCIAQWFSLQTLPFLFSFHSASVSLPKSTLFLFIFFLICSLFKLSACCLTLCRSYLCSARKCAVLSVELQSSQRDRPTNWEGTGRD